MTDQLKQAINAAQSAQNHIEKAAETEQAETIRLASSSAGEQTFDMSETTYKTSHTAVRKARRFAMQGLYEWLVTDRRFETSDKRSWKDNAPHDIAARTRATNAMHTVHIGYYHEMMRDIPEQIESLDALITQHLDREIDKLDTVEHAILLIGAYELQNRLEIPYKVVMDEAMKLNNHFGATDAHKLINAVLDRMAIELRSLEVEADTKDNKRNSQKSANKTQMTAQANVDNEATETISDAADKPTASTKPRISANKTAVKRDRPNKPNAGTATKQVVKKMTKPVATEQNMEIEMSDNIANIDSETNPITVSNNAIPTTLRTDSAVQKDKLLDTTDEADIGLENSNLLSSEDKASKVSEEKDNNSEAKD